MVSVPDAAPEADSLLEAASLLEEDGSLLEVAALEEPAPLEQPARMPAAITQLSIAEISFRRFILIFLSLLTALPSTRRQRPNVTRQRAFFFLRRL